ncbi:MAG: peptidase S1 and S6, chymotrypsin/Hap, partial [Gammaproteobacteria bacterium]|nr:peptidase S1 and S6, chymotrypsin/Hap [Gammaproteobacteria bacterium]
KAIHDRIYQIQTIELNSGSKSSLGSAFQVNANGLLVTNFHVVASYALEPEKYRIEYVNHAGQTGALELQDVDVVNDLALVQHQDSSQHFLELADIPVEQGAAVFSMGNPHDLGMTVVSGTFNGLTAHSYYDRMLFSGSINPGMSGGPALNAEGKVIGVNVATAGNQISFFVPLTRLRELLGRYTGAALPVSELRARMQSQLMANQRTYIETLLSAEWPVAKLGEATVIGEMTPFTRCWGASSDNQENRLLFNVTTSNCMNAEFIYLSNRFTTGGLQYEFSWLDTKTLNPFQFYQAYQEHIQGAAPINAAWQQDVTNFACHQDFVESGGDSAAVTKSILCVRAYKEFTGLYDFLYTGATVQNGRKGLISHFTISGIEKELGLQLTQKFIEHVRWTSLSN